MAIKVFLKRSVPDDKIGELKQLIDRLRSITTGRAGYVSGETMRRIDQPGTILVISKWKSIHDWERWFAHPNRVEIQEKIDALLDSPTQYEIYDYD